MSKFNSSRTEKHELGDFLSDLEFFAEKDE
jgi:hypothetical protein